MQSRKLLMFSLDCNNTRSSAFIPIFCGDSQFIVWCDSELYKPETHRTRVLSPCSITIRGASNLIMFQLIEQDNWMRRPERAEEMQVA